MLLMLMLFGAVAAIVAVDTMSWLYISFMRLSIAIPSHFLSSERFSLPFRSGWLDGWIAHFFSTTLFLFFCIVLLDTKLRHENAVIYAIVSSICFRRWL